jgi:polyisoprenoid-binding protein YceI
MSRKLASWPTRPAPFFLVLALALALSGPAARSESAAGAPDNARTYALDHAHTSVGFQIRHLVSRVNGRFTDFGGTIAYDPAAPDSSSVELVVQAASINTDNERRDDHLRSSDFFDVEKHPTLSFRSTGVAADGEGRLSVTGDLTIKGITRQVTVPVEVVALVPTANGEKAGFEATFTIDRKDFDVTWNRLLDHGGTVLGDEVRITLQVAADYRRPEA